MSTNLEVGKTYRINHSRKGVFNGRLISLDDTWAVVVITDGKAGAMLEYNERYEGETVNVRRSLASFTELEAA